MLSALWVDSAHDKLMIFSYFSQKINLTFYENCLHSFNQKKGFAISCKLSPQECQILFSGKKINKKNISKCHLLRLLSSVLSDNHASEESLDQVLFI